MNPYDMLQDIGSNAYKAKAPAACQTCLQPYNKVQGLKIKLSNVHFFAEVVNKMGRAKLKLSPPTGYRLVAQNLPAERLRRRVEQASHPLTELRAGVNLPAILLTSQHILPWSTSHRIQKVCANNRIGAEHHQELVRNQKKTPKKTRTGANRVSIGCRDSWTSPRTSSITR